ncbi:sulfite exporter TauE/SafE family protein [Jannaschia sp. S6380]|uniref:sulfite exporter TauE/SafE family protein n=1 Tax=Jannaschia sp. S6380 TaxID=2926408 RepID=UPI001FF68B1D|nr:sulfite exporter TauE/SafE family protein [Jannaschia sp. S6380]MCK0167808.1 sulfite exporter TauE/SafE family protein [Jannaschia sp. S6380]
MPDALGSVLAEPGLIWLAAAVFLAGLIYGFAGFGSALVFMPVGARILPPELAVAVFAITGIGSVFTMLPRTWPRADRPATVWMILAALASMPIGIVLLIRTDPVPLRWAICGLVALTLVAVVSGWKLRLGSGPVPRLTLGSAAGFVGGTTGLLGPVVILTTLASGDAADRMRANLSSFLTIVNVALLPMLWVGGALTGPVLWMGAVLLPVYMGGTLIGAALFRPGAERLYRRVAYLVVVGAVLLGLPLFD